MTLGWRALAIPCAELACERRLARAGRVRRFPIGDFDGTPFNEPDTYAAQHFNTGTEMIADTENVGAVRE